MTDDPTQPVELTLEESGVLCHMLLKAVVDLDTAARKARTAPAAFQHRMTALYLKLTEANDKLMGKIP